MTKYTVNLNIKQKVEAENQLEAKEKAVEQIEGYDVYNNVTVVEEKSGITNLLTELEELTRELDYMYQEGVIFNTAEVKTIGIAIDTLKGIHKDLTNKKLQAITRQVR